MKINGHEIEPKADLSGTDLSGTDLGDANLSGANLSGANLGDANLSGASLPSGETFEEYQTIVVPALLTAGGKTLKEVLSTGCWECHSWENCPMHAAFGIDEPEAGPILLRSRIKEFVQLFDAGILAKPTIDDSRPM